MTFSILTLLKTLEAHQFDTKILQESDTNKGLNIDQYRDHVDHLFDNGYMKWAYPSGADTGYRLSINGYSYLRNLRRVVNVLDPAINSYLLRHPTSDLVFLDGFVRGSMDQNSSCAQALSFLEALLPILRKQAGDRGETVDSAYIISKLDLKLLCILYDSYETMNPPFAFAFKRYMQSIPHFIDEVSINVGDVSRIAKYHYDIVRNLYPVLEQLV